MKKGHLTSPVMIIIALITIFVAATFLANAYLFGINKTPSPTPTPQSVVQTTQQQVPSPDETANWKTYTGKLLRISLKFPLDWTVEEEQFIIQDEVSRNGRRISVHNSTKTNSLDIYDSWGEFLPLLTSVREQQIIIDGIETKIEFAKGEFDPIDSEYIYALINRNNKSYLISAFFTEPSKDEETMVKILSTLKFTDQ